jgi:tetratricopeptide (TPR) repeat protein
MRGPHSVEDLPLKQIAGHRGLRRLALAPRPGDLSPAPALEPQFPGREGKLLGVKHACLALAALAGCAVIDPVPGTSMTPLQARAAMREALRDLAHIDRLKDVVISRRRLTFTGTLTAYGPSDLELKCEYVFADAGNLDVETFSHDWYNVRSSGKTLVFDKNPTGGWGGTFKTQESAIRFAQALLVLRDAADTEAADFAAFIELARSPDRPGMSEAIETRKALAEDAFKRKDFGAALDAYVAALEAYPLWPEGHYNAALLAAEVGDFGAAARHMRRYLALSPDAKDLEPSRQKYLLWRHKAEN